MGFLFERSERPLTVLPGDRQDKKTMTFDCSSCQLQGNHRRIPPIKPDGPEDAEVYLLAGVPTAPSDGAPRHITPKAQQWLNSQLPSRVLSDIRMGCALRCRPPKDGIPRGGELDCCRKAVEDDILITQPKLIIGLGDVVLQWATMYKGIRKWRGRLLPVNIQGQGFWFLPLHAPSELLLARAKRSGGKIKLSLAEEVSKRDFGGLPALVKTLEPPQSVEDPKDFSKGIEIYNSFRGDEDLAAIKQALKELGKSRVLGLDIETNGLRPFAAKAKILSIAIGTYDRTIAFPIHHSQVRWSARHHEELKRVVENFLASNSRKIAHNLGFEMEFLCYFYGHKYAHTSKWEDTQGQAYVLDTRSGNGVQSLDGLCRQYMGFNLKPLSAINVANLDAEPIDEVLKYNALDVKYTHRLYMLQMRRIRSEGLSKVYRAQVDRVPALILAQLTGLNTDQSIVGRLDDEIKAKLSSIAKEIRQLSDVHKYEGLYGIFNPASPAMALTLFTRVALLDMPDTEAETLQKVDHPLAFLLLKFRNLEKIHGTYITPLLLKHRGKCVWPDGKLHTQFKDKFVGTRRLSSELPNVQNFPKRKDAWVREVVVAPPGQVMCCNDYGQIEARIIGIASRDRVFCKALHEGYDVHMEWTERLARAYPARIGGLRMLKDSPTMKKFRTDVKNQWTFPLFYGCSVYSASNYLQIPLEKVKPLFEAFWEEFNGVRIWQKRLKAFYETNGYVESLFGFRMGGPLTLNQIFNLPIQSTASDVVITAMNRLSRQAFEEDRPQLQPVLNVHDDIGFYLPKPTWEEDHAAIVATMLRPIGNLLTVPMQVESSVGPDWFAQKEFGIYNSTILSQ